MLEGGSPVKFLTCADTAGECFQGSASCCEGPLRPRKVIFTTLSKLPGVAKAISMRNWDCTGLLYQWQQLLGGTFFPFSLHTAAAAAMSSVEQSEWAMAAWPPQATSRQRLPLITMSCLLAIYFFSSGSQSIWQNK